MGDTGGGDGGVCMYMYMCIYVYIILSIHALQSVAKNKLLQSVRAAQKALPAEEDIQKESLRFLKEALRVGFFSLFPSVWFGFVFFVFLFLSLSFCLLC
jgi:cytochrome c biogenesis protein ResB